MRRDPWAAEAGPVTIAGGGGLPACLPRTLTALCLSSVKAIRTLAGIGCGLAAGLPCLLELRMPVDDFIGQEALSMLSGSAGQLMEALLPLAGQLQVRWLAGAAACAMYAMRCKHSAHPV